MIIAQRLDLSNPVYIYSEHSDLLDNVYVEDELHISIEDKTGYCEGIGCSGCPMGKDSHCNIPIRINELFPELRSTHPEYFI